jgi:uncharacterized protein (TIGR02646 family)
MIYIKKENEPESLKEFIDKQISVNIHPAYGELDDDVKKNIRKTLDEAQGGLCCYCMNRITANNSRIEHFLPQDEFKDEELSYSNLFLACNHSTGKAEKFQHCDIKKGNQLIPKYISHPNCEDFFSYSASTGEILPNSHYKSIESCIKNYKDLNSEQKNVLATIETLNLNIKSLKDYRKGLITELIKIINGKTEIEIRKEITKYEERLNEKRKPFCGVALYFLKDYLKRKFKQA